jgi:hypothetical protein
VCVRGDAGSRQEAGLRRQEAEERKQGKEGMQDRVRWQEAGDQELGRKKKKKFSLLDPSSSRLLIMGALYSDVPVNFPPGGK